MPKKFNLNIVENPFILQRAEHIIAKDNKCYFFKDGRLTIIKVEELERNFSAPTVYFKNLYLGDEKRSVDSFVVGEYLKTRRVSISIDAAHYQKGEIEYCNHP